MNRNDNAPFGDSRPRSVMIIQHAIWYIMSTRLPLGIDGYEQDTIRILMNCLPQKKRK